MQLGWVLELDRGRVCKEGGRRKITNKETRK